MNIVQQPSENTLRRFPGRCEMIFRSSSRFGRERFSTITGKAVDSVAIEPIKFAE